VNLLIYIVVLINVIHAQIALPSFHGAQKPHTSVSSSGSQTFNYTGSQQTFTVPSGVSTITIKVWGGQGGSGGYYSSGSYCSTGGKGGYATGDLSVTAGNTVYVYVGGQGEGFATCNTYMRSQPQKFGGWNGGGNGYGGTYPGTGGGGASDIRYGGTSISDRKIIAGGGGGGGNAANNSTQLSNGGAGGGASGETMANSTQFYNRTPGSGATQSSGNSSGVGSSANQNLSGGGGGGYYGGGIGNNSTGGGGGSGYIGGVSNGSTITGNASMPNPDGGTMTGREGNGLIVISW